MKGIQSTASELKAPFQYKDVEWRISRAGEKNGKTWALCLAYIDNRAIMTRLDEVVGIFGWKNEFKESPNGGVLCGLSLKMEDDWITKWDGAGNTDFESVKGGLSDSMKRAAYQWGIGRYLYGLTEMYAVISESGRHYQSADKKGKYKAFKWDAPMLPDWALPKTLPVISKIITGLENAKDNDLELELKLKLKFWNDYKSQYTEQEQVKVDEFIKKVIK